MIKAVLPFALILASMMPGSMLPAQAADPEAGPWRTRCTGTDGQRTCTLSSRQRVANMRGGTDPVTISLMRGERCSTLHIIFERPIDTDQPVTLTIDDGVPIRFYTADELSELARAVDNSGTMAGGPSEFAAFLDEAAKTGTTADSTSAEMVARFARLKETRRAGAACAATERLLPALRAGHVLRLAYSAEPRAMAQIYHWPQLNARAADISLDGLGEALDRLSLSP